jgi:hypothetical protein
MKKTLILISLSSLTLNGFSQTIPDYVPTDGLVGWWPFNGNANDESANTNDGTVNGATLVPDRFSNLNSAYAFDGISSYIEVPDNSNLRLNNTDFTINFWMNVNSFNSVGTAIIYKRGNLSANGWAINCNSDDGNALEYTVSSGNDPQENSSTIPTLGLWQNITIVYSLSNQRISFYFNGVMDPANSTIIPTPNGNCNSVLRFGYDTYSPPNDYWLNGTLDDIGIWDRALTDCEIQELYNSQLTASPDNTVTQSGNTLAANQTGATYKWLDCDNGNAEINGETNQSFSPSISGNYKVEITLTDGACTKVDSSDCYSFTFLGLEDTKNNLFNVYPNPTKNTLTIQLNQLSNTGYTITDQLGKVVMEGNISSQKQVVDVSSLSNGIYFIKIAEVTQKFVKE